MANVVEFAGVKVGSNLNPHAFAILALGLRRVPNLNPAISFELPVKLPLRSTSLVPVPYVDKEGENV